MKKLISKAELIDELGVSFPTVWSWMCKGEFPRPIELSDNVIRWEADEIAAWRESRPRRTYKK